jgi:hypothetical protein
MQAFRKRILVVFAVAALLAACAPGQSPEQIQAQVETSVAMTVQAQNQMGTAVAQTVAAMAPAATETLTPTTIPLEVPTLTPIIDTSTPFTVVPPSGGGGGGGGGGGNSSSKKTPQYSCTLIGQVPNDGSPATILKVGDTLRVRWTFRNDGRVTWQSYYPWQFLSSAINTTDPANFGLTMSSVGSESELGTDVAPDGTITLGIFMTAPSSFEGRDPIHIGTAWTVIGAGTKLCVADINVEVIRPGMTP